MKKVTATLLILGLNLPLHGVFAQSNPAAFVSSDVEFARKQLNLVNEKRRAARLEPKVCRDELLSAESHYFEWIANYEPKVKSLYKLFDDAAFIVDSMILWNTVIPGFTYQTEANTAPINFTYANFREYLHWTRTYAATAPDLDALTLALEDSGNNSWGLSFSKAREIVATLDSQINNCTGDECVRVSLSAKIEDKKGVVIHASFPAKELTQLMVNHVIPPTQKVPQSVETLEYDLTDFIENHQSFEQELKTALGDMNPNYVKVAYAEPMRWNYFADSFIAKSCGHFAFPIQPSSNSSDIYTAAELENPSGIFVGVYVNPKNSSDVFTIVFNRSDFYWTAAIDGCDMFACKLDGSVDGSELACSNGGQCGDLNLKWLDSDTFKNYYKKESNAADLTAKYGRTFVRQNPTPQASVEK